MGRSDRRATASIVLKSVDGSWTTIGGEVGRGIVPEGLTCSANEAGPDTASFVLRREPSVAWPDLSAFNQCEISIGGRRVWGGRIWEAPISDGGEKVIQVQARGWQYHLDDDLIRRLYVATDLSAYRDQRSFPSASLVNHKAGPQIQASDGAITLIFPNGFSVVNADYATATIDLGSALAKRVVITWERIASGYSDADCSIYSRGSSSEDATTAGDDSFSLLTSASGVLAHTFSTARRYHHLILFRNGGTGIFGQDQGVRITAVKLFGETAYESGNASILKADQVLYDVLTSGALPLLDASTAEISLGSFSIPDLAPAGYQTPRALIAAANAYEGNLVGVDADRRLFSRERATVPDLEIGGWSGSALQDASTNSAEGLYSQVIVQGQTPDGTPIAEVRTATVSLLDRQGFTRTAVLQVDAPLTTGAAQALGDIWLDERAAPKFKGTVTIEGHGGARRLSGEGVHASDLLTRGGELLRLSHLIDPADGSQGRDGLIKSVQYVHDTETATVELDNERGNFATLLERLGANVSAALR